MTEQTETEKLLAALDWERRKIELRVEKIKTLPIELVKQAFPEGGWGENRGSDFVFTLPLRFELIDVFKEFSRVQGWQVKNLRRYVWDDKRAGDFIDIYDLENNYLFEVALRSSVEGSTCVINKIGEEMKPIFEVICGEGAKENTFAQVAP